MRDDLLRVRRSVAKGGPWRNERDQFADDKIVQARGDLNPRPLPCQGSDQRRVKRVIRFVSAETNIAAREVTNTLYTTD
jgi:hypothetical protein